MRKKGILSNFVGIFILMIGVIAGVILVDEVQDFKNRAKEKEVRVYTICRRIENSEDEWEEIKVDKDKLEENLNQGAILGKCPKDLIKN